MSLNCISKNRSKKSIEVRRLHQESKRRSALIDRQLSEDQKKEFTRIKLLLLGTGESGKTTVIKQMRIIHINGFSETEKMEFILNIKQNIRDAIVALVAAMTKLDVSYETKENEERGIRLISECLSESFQFPQEFFDTVEVLWKDTGILSVYHRSSEFQLIDSASYFLNRVDVIRREDFKPTLQDILRCRKMTDAINEVSFNITDRKSQITFKVFDVGGQQGERKKWIQLFDCVTAIVFLVDTSSFDLVLRENQQKNRLLDALEVFHQVWLNKYLCSIPVLVFLNKLDILERKMRAGRSLSPMFECARALLKLETVHTSTKTRQRLMSSETKEQSIDNENEDIPREKVKANISTSSSRRIRRYLSTCRIIVDNPLDAFQPSAEEQREVLHSFPSENKSNGSHSSFKRSHRGQSHDKTQVEPNLHPETVRTACYIRHIFEELTKQRRSHRGDRMPGFSRKCLYFYTCAVDTDNVEKVLEGCRVFLIEEHLEKFGIL